MVDFDHLKIQLTQEEKDILNGSQGEMIQKVMKTIVLYGEALEAERLVDITGKGHFVITHAIPGISPSMEMLDDLTREGLKTCHPFTLDPAAPLDYENWFLTPKQITALDEMYLTQDRYDEKMMQLGLLNMDACTCTPYLPEVGNIPERGDVLAWSESACAIFGNSVLGARTNRNGAIMDLLCNLVGKVPLSGFLTDQGRKATWLMEIKTDTLPLPQMLGAAIGKRVLADVPYIVGLDRFLGPGMNPATRDYLHEMGAACASAGAVALFHVENITPEAMDHGRDLLVPGYSSHVIVEQELTTLKASYPVLWQNKEALPEKCFLGCPHLSVEQMDWWAKQLTGQVKVNTTICAAPDVLNHYKEMEKGYQQLVQAGIKFSAACPMQLFDNDLAKDDAIITNSNKLRTYTTARFFSDEEIVKILLTGSMEGENNE